MIEQVRAVLDSLYLTEKERHMTLALSGGADSVALLYCLCQLRETMGLCLQAAHLNHGLRGQESDRDEAFVRELCQKWQVPLICEKADVDGFASTHHLGLEEAARTVRYDFLRRVTLGSIVTAHNATDQVETVLMHLCRGSGVNGLCGMSLRKNGIIRPLLFCTSADIRSFCQQEELSFVEDSTNNDDRYTRNFLRHRVLPLLKMLNPELETAVGRFSQAAGEDQTYFESLVAAEYNARMSQDGLSLLDWAQLPKAISNRLLLVFLRVHGLPETQAFVSALQALSVGSGRRELVRGKTVYVQNGRLTLLEDDTVWQYVTKLTENSVEVIKKDGKIHNLFVKNAIDCDKIKGRLQVRTRLPGDRIHLRHRGVGKSLKKLFIEEGVPQNRRNSLPVVADEAGVVWVCGFGVDSRVCPDETTRRVYLVDCKEENQLMGEM